MRYAFFYDQSRCMACNTCTVACKDWNQINPGPVRWRMQVTEELGTSDSPIFDNLSMSCNHCEDPACIPACAQNAISKGEDGTVVVDRSKCLELRSCITACPFATPQIAGDKQEPEKKSSWVVKHPMQKCDLCSSRRRDNEMPVCVSSCGAHALDFGDYEALQIKYPDAEQITPTNLPYAYKNKNSSGEYTDTKPNFLIRKRKPLNVI